MFISVLGLESMASEIENHVGCNKNRIDLLFPQRNCGRYLYDPVSRVEKPAKDELFEY